MASQTLFLRSTASTVVTATASCVAMSTTQGSSSSTYASIKYQTTTGSFQRIPGTLNIGVHTPGTPNTKGWIYDGSTAGTYASGAWTFTFEYVETVAGGSLTPKICMWVVTANTSSVSAVNEFANVISGTTYTGSLSNKSQSITFNPGAVTVATNQYLYLEVYLGTTGGSANATSNMLIDNTGATAAQIVTPNFTPGSGSTLSSNTPMNFYLLNLIH